MLEHRGQFDFVHANDGVTAPAAVYLSEVLAVPLISTVHGLESGRKRQQTDMSTHTGQSSNGFWLKKRSNPRAEQHDEVRHAKAFRFLLSKSGSFHIRA
ncbi:glycogen/starch synthase [Bacillus licheniformis]|nr:glycogen/starch synthase [Bacillus licheniformis]